MMETWNVVVQVIAILVTGVGTGVGTWAAVKSEIAVLHANQLNTKDDVAELKKDVKRHDRVIAGLDRRQADATGKYMISDPEI